jgi:hypothetical protein
MIIWIARKHSRHPYIAYGFLTAFEIIKTFATRKEAKAFVDTKNSHPNTYLLYSVGKVELK